MTRLEEIAARCEAATPGPWKTVQGIYAERVYSLTHQDAAGDDFNVAATDIKQDAEFIANAREDVPWLQSEVARLTKIVDAYAASARSIALWLKEYCDHSLAYSEMIADAARKAAAELAQYKQDIASGRMVVLPIWGNIYIKSNGQVQEMKVVHYSGNGMGVYAMSCECVDQYEDCDAICSNENEKACAYQFRVAEIGKTVFSTREAALEAAGGTE